MLEALPLRYRLRTLAIEFGYGEHQMGALKRAEIQRVKLETVKFFFAALVMVAVTGICYRLNLNLATTSLLFIVVIVLVSRTAGAAVSIAAALFGAVCLVDIAPPAYSFRVDDPFDVVAVTVFCVTSLVIVELVEQLRRMADEALASVDRRLFEAIEKERALIAKELHDDVKQRLALVSVQLDQLQNGVSGMDAVVRESFQAVHKQVSELATDVQTLAQSLYSQKLHILGIAATARSLCKNLSEKYVRQIEIHCDSVPTNLPEDVGICLYRVLQEALQNAVEHSNATHFVVRLDGSPGEIELSVQDTGIGFDPKVALKGGGLGLISMQERIRMMRGKFSIVSHANSGTTIRVRVPLRADTRMVANKQFGERLRQIRAQRRMS